MIDIADFVDILKVVAPNAQITFDQDTHLPYPADLSDAGLQAQLGQVPHTPLKEAMQQDLAAYKALLQAGKLDLKQLDN